MTSGARSASLVWSGDAAEPRALPAGTWRVRTTRIERVTKAGEHWFVSSTSPHGQELELENGKTAKLEVSPVVMFAAKAQRQGRTLQLGFAITGKDRRGLSVYRNKKRVPVRYEVTDKDGNVLSSGRMNYG